LVYQRWSNLQSRFTMATMFWRVGTIPSTAVMCCCSRVRGTGVNGTCVVGGEEGPAAAFGVTVTGMAAVVVWKHCKGDLTSRECKRHKKT
jgi:hypothetical protein